MRKMLLSIIAGFLIFVQSNDAQLTVTMSSVTVDPGAPASVDVTVNGFTNILGAQFSINYDSLVLEYVSVSNVSVALPGLQASSVSGPNGVGVKKGQIIFLWDDSQGTGKSLPNGTRLFTLNFTAIGAACTLSDVVTSNVPRIIEITNANFDNVSLTNVKGTVQVKCDGPSDPCPDPVCNNPANLTLTGAKKDANPGSNVCIPITVRNFKIMQSGQGNITWNPSLLTFTEIKNFGIPGMEGSLNTTVASTGQIGFVWGNGTPETPLTLPDSTVMMELCFNVVGPVGQTACVLLGQGTLINPTEWTTDNGEIPVCYSHGKVNIIGGPPPTEVIIKASTNEGKKDSIVCIDVRVDNFTNIQGMNFTMTWNASVMDYVNTGMYDLDGLLASAFTNTNNQLRFFWLAPGGNPVTKVNNHKIFQVCFLLKGACDATTAISFIEPKEIVGQNTVVVPHQTVSGSMKINCDAVPEIKCDIVSQTDPACNGASTGSITMNIVAPNNDCDCIWKRGDGTVIKNNKVTADCNLTNVPAGTYTYELSCAGVVRCTKTVTLNQPAALVIPTAGVVTNVGCGSNGAINLAPTGGTTPYSYNWNPAQDNIANPTNLAFGIYQVTVTDSRNCTATASFTIGNTISELIASSTVTHVKCKDGNDGSIQLTISGGCPVYSMVWSGGLSGMNPQNVRAGAYSVTVTDTSTPANSQVLNVTVTEPANGLNIALNSVAPDSPAGSNTGNIVLTVSGGTPGYSTKWTSSATTVPDGNTNGPVTVGNLAAGTYNITVTDANGCTADRNSIIVMVGDTMPTPKAPKVGQIDVASNFNGFGVPCNGNCNAVITSTLTEGNTPITAVLKRGTNTVQTLTLNALSEVRFTGICAGTYNIEFTNAVGTVSSTNVSVTQPTRLSATTQEICSDGDRDNGRIEINLNNTGISPYTFNWIGLPDNSAIIDDLPIGTYSVSITDANDCVLLVSNIDIVNCVDTENCYQAIPVITPNGDNRNDLFTINCVSQFPGDLTVFDRWGRIVYTEANYNNTWSGVDRNNNNLAEGAYMWVFDVNFGQGRREVYRGTVTILRL